MQRWTVDAASLVSLALVVAATATLPAPVAFSLACCELAFAASAAVRFSVHSAPGAKNGGKTARHSYSNGSASGARRQLLGFLNGLKSKPYGTFSPEATTDSSVSTRSEPHPELVANKLFDEREGHLPLLQGGHLLAQWFNGLSGPHQLHLTHVTQLLAYLLPSTCASAAHEHSAKTSTAPTTAPTTQHLDSNTPPATPTPTASTTHPDSLPACPRIRSWAARLMELIQHAQHPKARLDQDTSPNTTANTAATTTSTPQGNPTNNVKLLACTADPLVASYRPLMFYLITEVVAAATHVALLVMGFRPASTPKGTATVYVREPPCTTTAAPGEKEGDEPALVFLHGIGLGLTPYLRMLARLTAASGGRQRMFAVQYKHVSMRLTATIPAPQEVARDVAAFLASRGVRRMSLCAHSYGTLVASALTKLAAACPRAPAVSRLTLVDPVCFAMFLPHLVRNAIYQQPVESPQQQHADGSAPTAKHGLLRRLIKGLVVAEFHCSVALRRRLDWAAVNLWPSELPPDTTVLLAGRDNLVPVREVRHILATRAALLGPSTRHPTVLFHEDLGHGGFLAQTPVQDQVLAAVLGVSEQTVRTALAAEAATAPTYGAASGRRGPQSKPLLLPSVAPTAVSYDLAAQARGLNVKEAWLSSKALASLWVSNSYEVARPASYGGSPAVWPSPLAITPFALPRRLLLPLVVAAAGLLADVWRDAEDMEQRGVPRFETADKDTVRDKVALEILALTVLLVCRRPGTYRNVQQNLAKRQVKQEWEQQDWQQDWRLDYGLLPLSLAHHESGSESRMLPALVTVGPRARGLPRAMTQAVVKTWAWKSSAARAVRRAPVARLGAPKGVAVRVVM